MNRFERRKRNALLRRRGPELVKLGELERIDRGHTHMALRLVAGHELGRPLQIVGTAFMAGRGLALTAAHNIFEVFDVLGIDLKKASSIVQPPGISLIQVTPDREFVIWGVTQVFLPNKSDLALLEIEVMMRTAPPHVPVVIPILMLEPPFKGSNITGFGYRKSKLDVERNYQIKFTDEAILSKGRIMEVFKEQRDSYLLCYPSFEVNVRFDGGMSGGPIYDNRTGSVCGVIRSSIEDKLDSPSATSYGTTLWPILTAPLTPGRYPTLSACDQPILLDLALSGGGLNLIGLENLDPQKYPGREDHIKRYKPPRSLNV